MRFSSGSGLFLRYSYGSGHFLKYSSGFSKYQVGSEFLAKSNQERKKNLELALDKTLSISIIFLFCFLQYFFLPLLFLSDELAAAVETARRFDNEVIIESAIIQVYFIYLQFTIFLQQRVFNIVSLS